MDGLFRPLRFACGAEMKNRFMLAPLTNLQSRDDGVLSEEELNWLRMRARGGFGVTMTCAAHVQAAGQGFPGQLGIWSDRHEAGLSRLALEIRRAGSLSVVQLHHAGMRSPADLIRTAPLCPSDDRETGARALSAGEVRQLNDDFVAAAERADRCGFDGVELHGAHGYIIGQFLSAETNRRSDDFGGCLENRCRLLFDILKGIRQRCRPGLIVGVRLSPERFGMRLEETRTVAAQLMKSGRIDFLDLSLWDAFKEPEEETFRGRTLLSYFTGLERGHTKLAVAGKIRTPADARAVLGAGADIISLGRAAILHHDYPRRCAGEPDFTPMALPVSRAYLSREGLTEKFIDYLSGWRGFVDEDRSGDRSGRM
jgi:2,4-dienoyl-CoA reductase-like NADH-dependent reductase (Old Yellow Enzyme family)